MGSGVTFFYSEESFRDNEHWKTITQIYGNFFKCFEGLKLVEHTYDFEMGMTGSKRRH